MEWVIGSFNYMERNWKERVLRMEKEEKPGHKAYAAREVDRWNRWAKIAGAEFAKATGIEVCAAANEL